MEEHHIPQAVQIRNAHVHNLKNIDVNIPLHQIVGIAGVSGSGKSSLALGVLYAEGSRRYLDALSTYTRRRMTQAARAGVDEVLYVPAALALHQRPGVPGIRSTFGTGTELLNSLRLMYSRLSSHRCPNGHYLAPSLRVAAGKELLCPECGAQFLAPSAEELAFNSQGACPQCGGIGTVRTVDPATLVPDDSLTIDEGALTVNGYLGTDGIKPLLKICKEEDKGIFVLVKPSNPSSGELQDKKIGRRTVYEVMGSMCEKWGKEVPGDSGYSAVGAVVGATYPEQLSELREKLPHTFFLVPGYGAQGGGAKDVAGAFDENGLGAIVNSSRGIICAYKKGDWKEDQFAEAARAAAIQMRDDIGSVVTVR